LSDGDGLSDLQLAAATGDEVGMVAVNEQAF
jgi:hypothetical protein